MDGRLWAAWVLMSLCTGHPVDISQNIDVGQDRKLLGSSVVTSVSVIMDHGNGTKTFITDSEQAPSIARPEIVGTPGTLMAPDRYEFYSFGKDGELVKKLMSLEEIQELIAAGDELSSSEEGLPVYYHEPLVQAGEPEGVSKVLESVQNVLKGELQNVGNHDKIALPPLPDDSWRLLSGDMDLKESVITKKPMITKPSPRPKPQVQSTQPTSKPIIYKPTIPYIKQTTTKPTTKQPVKPIQYKPAKPTYNHSPLPTSRKPSTTVKYSAHYSTPPPNLTSKNPQPTKPTKKIPPSTKRPEISTTYKSTTKDTYQTQFVTEKTRPSGIPTITHYLPIQSSKPTSHFPTSSPLTTQKITTPKTAATTAATKTTLANTQKTVTNTQKAPANTTKVSPVTTTKFTTPKPTETTYKTTQETIPTTKRPIITLSTQKTTPEPPITKRLTQKPTTQLLTTQKSTTQAKTQSTTQKTTTKPTTKVIETTTTTPTTVSISTTELPKKTTILPQPEKLVDIKVPLEAESSNIESVKVAMPIKSQGIKLTTQLPLTTKVQLPVLTTLKQKPEISTYLPITSIKVTTLPPTTEAFSTQATTAEAKNTVTETLPTTMLEEIPLRIYESLKDHQSNVFAMPSLLDTTTYRETTEITTSITDETNSSDSTTTESSNFRTEKIPETTKVQITTTVLDTTTQAATTQDFGTTELSGTTYKDKVMEDGISAVTNILLDMNKGLVQNNTEPEATTENEQTETVYQTEIPTSTTNLKTETRTENYDTTTFRSLAETVTTEIPVKNKSEPLNSTKPVIPIKVSKLNPETLEEPHQELTKNIPTTSEPQIKEKTAPKENEKINRYKTPAYQTEHLQPSPAIDLHPAPYESMGLEASTAFLSEDVRRFADLCNELAFRLWTSLTGKGQISSRSLVLSPFAATSLLAMVFLGARGATSGQMNDILRLDDMVTFNPHQVLQNVTDSVLNSKNYGVATAAFVRELYSDKAKGKLLDFYKERAQQYYQGHVEELNFHTIGDIIRRRTNLLIKRQTLGKVPEYMRGSSLQMRPPLAAFSANIFQTDCEQGSTEGRDGEMYFVVRPSTRQRRLVPVPAVVWRTGFLAGYEPSLDATSVCLGPDSVVSTILVLPGQQGQVAPGDGLARLEQRLIETSYRRGGWSRLLRSLLQRPGLELQVPRFSHRSVLNITTALQRMGLKDLFDSKADLRGLNGISNDLHLSDMVQVNTFSTCGEETIGARHHIETYPSSPQRVGRDEPELYPPRDFENSFANIPLSLRPRQARLPDSPRLRFDRPFLYLVRHNPSGMILHMGRFNPRLLP